MLGIFLWRMLEFAYAGSSVSGWVCLEFYKMLRPTEDKLQNGWNKQEECEKFCLVKVKASDMTDGDATQHTEKLYKLMGNGW